MSRLVSELITSARGTLNDEDDSTTLRYTSDEMIRYVVDGLNLIRNVRPDLFIGQFSTPIGTLTTASTIPLDEQFFRPLVDYVIARCEMKDDEAVVSARAELMARMASGFLQ